RLLKKPSADDWRSDSDTAPSRAAAISARCLWGIELRLGQIRLANSTPARPASGTSTRTISRRFVTGTSCEFPRCRRHTEFNEYRQRLPTPAGQQPLRDQ